jgi:choline kinase
LRAVILAAGEGHRLRPHTLDRPKCMVALDGAPLLFHQLVSLRRAGIDDITLVTGYRADCLESLGFPTRHNGAFDRTNMVSSLMCAADRLDGGDDVLITYADIVYEPRVLEPLLRCPAALAVTVDTAWQRLWALRQEDPLDDAETLRLTAEGDILELGKKPRSVDEIEGQYMGIIKVSATFAPKWVEAHAGLDPEARYDGKDLANLYMTSFLQHLIDTGNPLRAVLVEGGWLEVDTSRDLEIYENLAERGELGAYYRAPKPSDLLPPAP